jgi:hypothetical protein
MKQKYCSYGRHFVPQESATLQPKPPGSPPTYICASCKARRALPPAVLARLTEEEREARRATSRLASKEALRKRKENG